MERLLDAIRRPPPHVFVITGLYAGAGGKKNCCVKGDRIYGKKNPKSKEKRERTKKKRTEIEEEKKKEGERKIPLPVCLAECLKAGKETSTSEYVVSNRDGEPLSYTQFKRLWQYIVTRTVKERAIIGMKMEKE